MLTPRGGPPAAVEVNGILYVMGGSNSSGNLSSVEAYDPTTNTWTSKAPMPTPRAALSAAVVNGMIYAIGGFNGAALSTVEAYNPATNTWTTMPSMPTQRFALGAAETNGVIYAVGGVSSNPPPVFVATVEAFIPPATNNPPMAICQNVTVAAGPSCTADASINNGSFDPDGDPITFTHSPSGPYPLGSTSVTMTVTDSKGASSSCTATVTVVDDTPPQFASIPADASYQCAGEVPPAHPSQATATDNCGTPTITVSDSSNGGAGSPSSPLVITQTYTATDAAGNHAKLAQTITVIDNTPPAVSCPATPTTLSVGANCQAAIPDVTGTVGASDNCTPSASLIKSQTPAAGTMVSIGMQTVTVRVTDAAGNNGACTVTLNVVDKTAPTITCPPAQTIECAGTSGSVATFSVTASDNCDPNPGVACNPPSGSVLPKGTTTVTCTATDASGNSSNCSFTVNVVDTTPPVVTLNGSDSMTVECHTSFTDPGATANDACAGPLPITLSGSVNVNAVGTYTLTYSASDPAGLTATKSRTVNVVDTTPPAITLAGPGSMMVECHTSFTDPGASASDACAGDLSSRITVAGSVNANAPGTYTLTYSVSDSAGNAAIPVTRTINVVDTTAPRISCPSAVMVECTGSAGATATYSATATDACDASASVVCSPPSGSVFPKGTTTVNCTAKDASANSSNCSFTVTVADTTPPVITLNGGNPMTVECHTSFTDPGSTASDVCAGPVSVTTSGNVNVNLPGIYAITYTASDGTRSTTVTRTVNVVDTTPPTITCPMGVTVAGNIANSCSAMVNPPLATAADNCSGVTVAGVRSDGLALNAPYPPGTTTITWTATDNSGNQSSCSSTVTVTNPPPRATITGPQSGAIYSAGTPVTFTGTFTDNPGGYHTAEWKFDTITQAATVSESTGQVSATYTFAAAGVYLVSLTVNDGCGGSDTASTVDELMAMIVIYDPNAGFVTGGGWINSPAGAYAANPSLIGKASFGFVSKYERGASVPSGNTEFQFRVANFNFKSTAYEWLVVAGARAQYKGSGTINGAGDYGFMLTAIDGEINGGGGVDKFRMKIWDKTTGQVIYDNQMGATDSADPTIALGGGSIVIHH